MNAERRRWRCPECQREYQIPVAAEDPMVCPACAGEGEASGSWAVFTETSPESEGGTISKMSGSEERESFETRVSAGASGNTESNSLEGSGTESEGASFKRKALKFVGVFLMGAAVVGGSLFTLSRIFPEKFEKSLSPSANIDQTLFEVRPIVRTNPDADAPLVALIDFATRTPVVSSIEMSDGSDRWTYRPSLSARKEHHLAVMGIRPDRTYLVRIRVESPDGSLAEETHPIRLTTPPLPDDFPPLETLVSHPDEMEPGVTLFAINLWRRGKRARDFGYLIALDARGNVVWFYRSGRRTADIRLLENGHLLFNDANYVQVREVDLLGQPIRGWLATRSEDPPKKKNIPIEADTLHHEILEMPSGNFLALSTELREIENFPTSETDPSKPPELSHVVGDVIMEYEPDGKVVNQWKLLDLLDPHRIGYGSLSDFWKNRYDKSEDVKSRDWSHANAVCLDSERGSMIVSVRHQDCLVKIDRKSSQIEWILGVPDGWKEPWKKYLLEPEGDLQWFYHQHGPEITPEGTILMYDNGNYRALPFDPKTPAPENYSRVVEYEVDEEKKTVKQVWEYKGPDDKVFFSPFYCEADWLPETENILITDGGRIEKADGTQSHKIPSAHQWARILEVTHTEPAKKVFEVVIDSGLDSPWGWSIYRSERLPEVQTLSDLATAARKGDDFPRKARAGSSAR